MEVGRDYLALSGLRSQRSAENAISAHIYVSAKAVQLE